MTFFGAAALYRKEMEMDCYGTSENETAAAVTEAMRTRLQPYLFAERDTVYACVHSFGCQLNVSDGERIRGMLTELGYTMTDSYEKADLILFNTCAVRESAEDRVYGMLGNIKKYKKTNPNLILVLCGCMASEEHTAEFVRSHYPYVDIVFGTASLSRFPGLLLEHFQGKSLPVTPANTTLCMRVSSRPGNIRSRRPFLLCLAATISAHTVLCRMSVAENEAVTRNRSSGKYASWWQTATKRSCCWDRM